MKQLICTPAPAPATPTIEPAAWFLNLYTDRDQPGTPFPKLEDARNARGTRCPVDGITIKISRDTQGDFTIEKVEEF